MNYIRSKGLITENFIAFYEERAKGGCGLVVVGWVYFTKNSFYMPNMLNLMDKEKIRKLKIFANTFRKAGAKFTIQLLHPGRYAVMVDIYTPSVVKSGIKSTVARMPKELTIT